MLDFSDQSSGFEANKIGGFKSVIQANPIRMTIRIDFVKVLVNLTNLPLPKCP